MFVSVSEALPLCDTRRPISSSVHRNEPSWVVATFLPESSVDGVVAAVQQEDCLQEGRNRLKNAVRRPAHPTLLSSSQLFQYRIVARRPRVRGGSFSRAA